MMRTRKVGAVPLAPLLAPFLALASMIIYFPAVSAKPVDVPVVYYQLPNGLKVVISEDHVAPVVTVGVYYNVGFRVEPKRDVRRLRAVQAQELQKKSGIFLSLTSLGIVEGLSLNGEPLARSPASRSVCRA